MRAFEVACADVGRDFPTVGRSAGVGVAPLAKGSYEGAFGSAITGSAEEIADALRAVHSAGFSQLEVLIEPMSTAGLEAMAPVLELLAST